jgi:4-alpha-glucanotransferase
MKILFRIEYFTEWGQEILVCGSSPELGNWDTERALHLRYTSEGVWEGSAYIKKEFEYKYLLKDINGHVVWEWGPNRKAFDTKMESLIIDDTWRNPGNVEKALHTSAFKNVLSKVGDIVPVKNIKDSFVELRIKVPRISEDFNVCILGNKEILGDWNVSNKKLLSYDNASEAWIYRLEMSNLSETVEYKYGFWDVKKDQLLFLEAGANRKLYVKDSEARNVTQVKTDESFMYPVDHWKGAGVSVPVFSLRTDEGFGVGEFNDLIPFIDWAKSVGMKMVQILPINETIASHSWLDSYPYKAISTIALHPMYLNVDKMGVLKDRHMNLYFEKRKSELNSYPVVHYTEVMEDKSRYFKLLYDQEGEFLFKSSEYLTFYKNNKDWLVPYAAFAYFRDKFKTADFSKWGDEAKFDRKHIERISEPESPWYHDIAIHYFIQYHLDKQMKEVTEYARNSGIVLKGDIPIGISPESLEAWTEPHLFNLNGQAGSPPDDFAVDGQNWGFPTYNWEVMEKDDYAWWRKRLKKMAEYFDAYRIDHIIGFFRIWEVPGDDVLALGGYFKPSLPYHADEIRQRGIDFNHERMAEPYIREHFLGDIFGEYTEEVKWKYLSNKGNGVYELRDEYATQKKVNIHFLANKEEEELEDKERKIRDGLFTLINNVLFIQYPYGNGAEYVPRISLHNIKSFHDLDPNTKVRLNDLYIEFFYHRHDEYWYKEAMKRLPALLNATDMLVCGEDLGMVPASVPPLMDKLGILSLEIQRMPKNPKRKFAHPADAPYLSVCTTSTHDMSTVRGWWEEEADKIGDFYRHELGNDGNPPYFAETWVCSQIINQHLFSPAMWVTIPIQDYIAMDGALRWENTHSERINIPSNVRHRWRFRMKQSISDLNKAENLNAMIKSMVTQTNRNSPF